MNGGYETKDGGTFTMDFRGPVADAGPVKEFLDAQLRSAASTTMEAGFEIVFDTLASTRKCQNLRHHPRISVVLGWEQEITVQYEGTADEPTGSELERLTAIYFAVYPECMSHQNWEGITYVRIRPTWIRYSDFNPNGKIIEFSATDIGADIVTNGQP